MIEKNIRKTIRYMEAQVSLKTETVPDRQTIEISDFPHFREFCGVNDQQIDFIQKKYGVEIYARNGSIFVSGGSPMVMKFSSLFAQYNELVDSGIRINQDDLKFAIKYFVNHDNVSLHDMFGKGIRTETSQKVIVPRSMNQRAYVYSLYRSTIIIGVGPAGTGKTYLAMAVAVSELLKKKINKIILTRPAVEAGERLGFLPGDLDEKISPYLRPLYDAMYDTLGAEKLQTMMENGEIEVAPLAYMRGRTLNDSFIILDEAQNCTSQQMKMFLTRLGKNSRMAITGDITQSDLPREKRPGLLEVKNILKGIEGIDIINFTRKDVVRHPLVEKIIHAYEKLEDGPERGEI